VAVDGRAPAVEIFVFPTDERFWVEYSADPLRMRRTFVREAGDFALPLPAGQYYVVATSSRVPPAWQEPARLRWLARAAETVVIPESGRVVRNLGVRELLGAPR
jgi:hypothetical protein